MQQPQFSPDSEGVWIKNPYHKHYSFAVKIIEVREKEYLIEVLKTGERILIPHRDLSDLGF